jgi:hypothetical protein
MADAYEVPVEVGQTVVLEEMKKVVCACQRKRADGSYSPCTCGRKKGSTDGARR